MVYVSLTPGYLCVLCGKRLNVESCRTFHCFHAINSGGDMSKQPLLLMILDGWGINPHRENNAIAQAQTPEHDPALRRLPLYRHRHLGHVGGAARRADGELGGGAPEHRRRTDRLPGPDPDQQGDRGRRFLHQSGAPGLHRQDQGRRRAAPPGRPALRRRRPLPQHPPLCPAGAGPAGRAAGGVRPLPAGRPRHPAPERRASTWPSWKRKSTGSASGGSPR